MTLERKTRAGFYISSSFIKHCHLSKLYVCSYHLFNVRVLQIQELMKFPNSIGLAGENSSLVDMLPAPSHQVIGKVLQAWNVPTLRKLDSSVGVSAQVVLSQT